MARSGGPGGRRDSFAQVHPLRRSRASMSIVTILIIVVVVLLVLGLLGRGRF
jgi:hypothetical protein